MVPIVTYFLLYLRMDHVCAPPDAIAGFEKSQLEGSNENSRMFKPWRNGDYWEISPVTIGNTSSAYMGLIFNMRLPKILAMFLLGLYAYRRGFFQNPSRRAAFYSACVDLGICCRCHREFADGHLSPGKGAFPPSVEV